MDTVILLHGIARTHRSMKPLEKALCNEGYRVLNIHYPSRHNTVEDNADFVYHQIISFLPHGEGKMHFVSHSMGGLVIRELLGKYTLSPIGHIVMIAPPNQGSEVADLLKNNYIYQQLFGPAGQQLTTEVARNNPFPLLEHSVGIIAGNLCIEPLSYFLLPRPHDGRVTVNSTKLAQMRDHIVIRSSHPFIMRNKHTIQQVRHFLKHGTFKR